MAETMQSLDQLATLKPAAPEAPKYVQKLDKQGRSYATGKRKDAVARVWLKPGPGKIQINERAIEIYFARPVLRMLIQQPLVASNRSGQFDIVCTVSGGGLSGQAGAVRHGISKALTQFEPDLRGVLKRGGTSADQVGGAPPRERADAILRPGEDQKDAEERADASGDDEQCRHVKRDEICGALIEHDGLQPSLRLDHP